MADEKLVLSVDREGVVRLTSRRERLEQAQGMFASISPNRVLSDELFRERQQEASRENR